MTDCHDHHSDEHHHHDHHSDHHEHHHHHGDEFCDEIWDDKKWSSCWEENGIYFNQPHECLVKYQHHLLGDRKGIKIFVPLCGRAIEMKYLAELGHEIVGLDFAEIAVEQFFKVYNISYKTEPLQDHAGTLYRSTEEKLNIRIYCCDFFKFGPHLEKDFGAVWDAGAMHSLLKSQMKEYVTITKSVLGEACHSLVEFDFPSCGGEITTDELQTMYGDAYTVDNLGYTKTENKSYAVWGIEGFTIYHVTLK